METMPSGVTQETPTLPRAPRVGRAKTWPAVLTLYILAPLCGEVLSGSTPPFDFFTNPLNLLYLPALYGSGAILARELVRRRGLGWGRLILLGAAYGILEEGLVVTSWFNPYFPDLGPHPNFGRALGIVWPWALVLTAFHAIVSITVPIVLTETLFPRVASQPWLRRRGMQVFTGLLIVVSALGFIGFGVIEPSIRSRGAYHGPPLSYLLAVPLAAGVFWLGIRRPGRPTVPLPTGQTLPSLWALRSFGLVMTGLFFMVDFGQGTFIKAPPVQIALLAILLAVVTWRVATWARRTGWGARQRLALASGVIGFMLLLAPLLALGAKSGKATWSLPFAIPVWLAFIIVLAVRARRTEQVSLERPTLPLFGVRPNP